MKLIKQAVVTSSRQDHMTNWKHTSITRLLMATKLGGMVTILECNYPALKSHDSMITWSCEITWLTETIYTTLVHMATKIGKMLTNFEGLFPGYSNLWSRGPARSRDKLKLLYLHHHNVYGHITWYEGNLLWATFSHKVLWPL